ncbi:TIGR03086 family metal-binding protein [Nonomuraea sp. NPDC002799]
MITFSVDERDLDQRALAAAGLLIARIGPEDLARPTPCAAWSLGELLRHMVSENHGFAAVVAGMAADEFVGEGGVLGDDPHRSVWDSGVLGDDPHGAFQQSAVAVTAAFAAEDVYDRRIAVREFGVFPGRVAIGMHVVDFLVHGWDIAAAIGAPYPIDEESVAGALAIAARWPDTPRLRGPGRPFGARVPVPAGASDLERLLGLLGRSPAWTPSC